jgi:hypothetical protein
MIGWYIFLTFGFLILCYLVKCDYDIWKYFHDLRKEKGELTMNEQTKQALDKAAKSFGVNWYRNSVWHDVTEVPVYHDDCFRSNQIAVTGGTSDADTMAVCSMISENEIYSPVSRKEYKWGECPFTKWAYVEDLLPTSVYMEFSSKIKTEE